MLRLVGTDGNKLYSWDLSPGTYSIGRKPERDVYIPNRTISREHAEIIVESATGAIYVLDKGSHNGTSVNGRQISEMTELREGDTVRFGEAEFQIRPENASAVPASRPTATRLSEVDLEKSVYLSIDEALKPLPSKVADTPELFHTFSEMARMLVLHEAKEVMLEQALKLIAKVIPAERLAVLTTSDDRKEVHITASLLPDGKDPGAFQLSTTIIDDILTLKQAILISDPASDSRYASQQSIIMSAIKSAMAVPIFDEGEIHGILYIDTSNPRHRYSDDFLRLLATFGNIIASRLQNYTLAEQREEKKILDAELRRASSIQQRLLVSDMPTIEGYSMQAYQDQCRAVGGDLYDVATLPDGRTVLLVADVSGKGMGAALLMANILASFRILFGESVFDIARAVQQVNRQLHSYSDPGDFATLFVGLIDPVENKLIYVNAGHNSPMILNADGSIALLEPCGFMIGAFEMGQWEEQSVALNPGDLLLVFTDGVTEAEGANEQYGEARLMRFMSGRRGLGPEVVVRELVAELEEFTADQPQSDDITMLVVKRNG